MKWLTIMTALLCFLQSCTMIPSRKLIGKGHFESEVAVSALLGNPKEGFPAVPNLNIGARYGVSDYLNVGASAHPLTLLLEGTVMVEPYVVARLLEQQRWRPGLNLHLGLPILIAPFAKEAVFFPSLGLTPTYSHQRSIWYMSFEASFDRDAYSSAIDPHVSLRGGWDFTLKPWLSFVIEGGLANIGRESIITNSDVGQPILGLGLSYNIQKKRESRL